MLPKCNTPLEKSQESDLGVHLPGKIRRMHDKRRGTVQAICSELLTASSNRNITKSSIKGNGEGEK